MAYILVAFADITFVKSAPVLLSDGVGADGR